VHQLNAFASGTVRYGRSIATRAPARRICRPLRTHVNGREHAADERPRWRRELGPDVEQSVTTAVVGDLVTIVNKATNRRPARRRAAPARTRRPDRVGRDRAGARTTPQVNVFISTNIVKDYVHRYLDPNMPKLGEQMTANVTSHRSATHSSTATRSTSSSRA